MRKKSARLLTIKGNRKDCEYRTFVLCKSFINDQQWHWQEIITFHSCDRIVTYSTSNQAHFEAIKSQMLRRTVSLGSRNYDGLEFEVFQRNRTVIEVNQHPNQEGLLFYMFNVIRS